MRYVRRGSFVFLLSLATLGTGRGDELSTLAGKKTSGKVVAVDANGVTFAAGGVESKVPAKDIAVVDLGVKAPPAPAKDHSEIELTDGSVFRADAFLIPGKVFKLTLLGSPAAPPAIDLPLRAVFTVMRGAHDAANREAWKKMLANRGKRDLYVIRQADGLNFLPGTLLEGNDTGEAVTFEREDGQRSPLKLSRASGGLVFNQPPQGVIPPTLCKVFDAYGNTLFAKAVDWRSDAIVVKTVAGATVTYPGPQGIARLDFGQGNVAYLSDLDPQVTAPEREPGDPGYTYLRDKNQVNAPLQLEKTVYPRGLWVYADTSLTFAIGGDYREFKATLGTDETIPNGTTEVKVTVEGDGRVLYSETVKRSDKPRPLNIDVKDVKQLRIAVEADSPYNGNQVILGDAKVQK